MSPGCLSRCACYEIFFYTSFFYNKFYFLDVITDFPDKKSIMMYVMCYFQVLSKHQLNTESPKNTPEVSFNFFNLNYFKITIVQKSIIL